MMLAENAAAIIAAVMCLVCFAGGYALRSWIDDTRAEWAAFAYRERIGHGRR